MFYHDKEAGWKERGAGMLKINVPQACIEFDENGSPILGSFDASSLEGDDGEDDKAQVHKVVRLLMRQDQTHRVILNTAILPAMDFQEKASLKSVGILFTAFEGEQAKPVSITMRVSFATIYPSYGLNTTYPILTSLFALDVSRECQELLKGS